MLSALAGPNLTARPVWRRIAAPEMLPSGHPLTQGSEPDQGRRSPSNGIAAMQRPNASSAFCAPSSVKVRDDPTRDVTSSWRPLANRRMNGSIVVLGVPPGATTRIWQVVSVWARAVKPRFPSVWNVIDSPDASQVIVISRNIIFARPAPHSLSAKADSPRDVDGLLASTQSLSRSVNVEPATNLLPAALGARGYISRPGGGSWPCERHAGKQDPLGHCMTISTRRFCGSRTPAPVGTSRWVWPNPRMVMAAGGTPSRTSSPATACARRTERP